MRKNNSNKCILQFLLYSPRVYSGLDHLMVETTRLSREKGFITICVFADTMEHIPQLQLDIEAAGGIVELVRTSKREMLKDIWQLYRKYRPMVVDTHFIHRVKFWTCIFSCLTRAKHFTHIHSQIGPDVKDYVKKKGYIKRSLLGVYYLILGIFSKKILCVSDLNRRQYLEWSYGAHHKAETLYMGTQIHIPIYSKLEARNILGLPQDKHIITNVSAIEEIKGIDLIIKAIAMLKQQGKDVLFAHLGGLRGDTYEQQQYADSLKQMALDLDVQENVIWLGKRNNICDILSFADVYVHPSLTEGLPSALMEAAMAGLPLIATKAGGMPEIVKDQVTGRLIDSGNFMQLANTVEEMLTKEHRFGDNARKMVYQIFDQTKQAKKLLNLYNIAEKK